MSPGQVDNPDSGLEGDGGTWSPGDLSDFQSHFLTDQAKIELELSPFLA
jgi:hypothetical protein